MKTNPLIRFALILSLLFAVFVVPVGCSGCKTGQGQLNPATGVYDTNAAADTLVVTVENTREIALGVFDDFMRIEKQNDAAFRAINPRIHEAAELVRRDGRRTLDALTNAKVAFQASRSAEDAAKLKSAWAAVQSLLKDSLKYIAEIAAKKGTQ